MPSRFIENKHILFAYNQQTTSSKLLTMPIQWSIEQKDFFMCKKSFTESSRFIFFLPSSNNTPSIPPSSIVTFKMHYLK